MGLADFGITIGNQHYTALRVRYSSGVKWIRNNVGSSVDMENGVPFVRQSKSELRLQNNSQLTLYNGSLVDALIQNRLSQTPLGEKREHFIDTGKLGLGLYPVTTEGEGIAYAVGIYGLDEPWGDMLTYPYNHLNREISRLAGKYDSPD